ncbi:hypothetical protein CgunFtcFv8_010992 [Champsocephalus gunnari]|uniref:Uncharacterized protein n=1 Tax=Champsocephalus gunnari TaxID=52237 RepID=A0AAN8E3W4_CHAGU|nr:hypothetical protein CgunFtcFv8_010992 [Champsocephalus gunnari]
MAIVQRGRDYSRTTQRQRYSKLGKTATALLESLQDDYIGTREEEHSRTTVDGRVPSTSSSNPERTPAEESTPTQPPTPSAITTPQRVVLGKRKRGSGPAGTAP